MDTVNDKVNSMTDLAREWIALCSKFIFGTWSMHLGESVTKTLKSGAVKTYPRYDIVIGKGQLAGNPEVGMPVLVRKAQGEVGLFILDEMIHEGLKDGYSITTWLGHKVG